MLRPLVDLAPPPPRSRVRQAFASPADSSFGQGVPITDGKCMKASSGPRSGARSLARMFRRGPTSRRWIDSARRPADGVGYSAAAVPSLVSTRFFCGRDPEIRSLHP